VPLRVEDAGVRLETGEGRLREGPR
jgi:hypothetical protein